MPSWLTQDKYMICLKGKNMWRLVSPFYGLLEVINFSEAVELALVR